MPLCSCCQQTMPVCRCAGLHVDCPSSLSMPAQSGSGPWLQGSTENLSWLMYEAACGPDQKLLVPPLPGTRLGLLQRQA